MGKYLSGIGSDDNWSNREGLSRSNSENASSGCYQYFGIRSHLHHFYDYGEQNGIHDEEDQQLIQRPEKQMRRCSSVLWKVLLWLSVLLLVSGAGLILAGRFIPKKPELTPATEDGRFIVINEDASHVNKMIESMSTVGMVVFCTAGVMVIIAVLMPTYFSDCCSGDRTPREDDLDFYTALPSGPASHASQGIPVTSLLANVQPDPKSPVYYGPID